MLDKLILWPLFTVLLIVGGLCYLAIGGFMALARLLDNWSVRGPR